MNWSILRGMSDEIKFCFKCGANVPEGSAFCPECGASLTGNNDNRTEYTAVPTKSAQNADGGIVPILIMIYGVLAIIGGLLVIIVGISVDSLINMMEAAVEQGTISAEEYELFVELTKSLNMLACTLIGVLLISSGVLALISGIWSSNLKNWKLSVLFCGIAALLPALSIMFDPITAVILPVVGLLMTYFLYSKKNDFQS